MAGVNMKTFENAVIKSPLVVLRKVDFDLLDQDSINLLANTQIAYKQSEGSLLWFADGYVLNDHPRAAGTTAEIMLATFPDEFAVGRTDNQTIMAKGLTLRQASQAVKGATITLDLDISLPKKNKIKAADDAVAPAS